MANYGNVIIYQLKDGLTKGYAGFDKVCSYIKRYN
nr:MAG TPA: hypothetical protein [Caudoviricetes sp.]